MVISEAASKCDVEDALLDIEVFCRVMDRYNHFFESMVECREVVERVFEEAAITYMYISASRRDVTSGGAWQAPPIR